MRRRGVKPTGKSHSICRHHFLSARQKQQSARQKRVAHPRQTSRIVTFVYVYVFLTLFYAIFSMVKSHACHVAAYRVTFVYIFSKLFYVFFLEFRSEGSEAWLRHAWIASCVPQVSVCSQWCKPSGLSALLAVRNSWNQSIRGWITPIQPNMLAAIDVCNTKDSCLKTAHRQRPGTLQHCF